MVLIVTLGQQYNTGENPIVMLYTSYIINRHAGTPDKNKKNNRFSVCDFNLWIGVNARVVVARFARRYLRGICAAVSVGSQCEVARFARRHLRGICAAARVESQCVVWLASPKLWFHMSFNPRLFLSTLVTENRFEKVTEPH